MNRSFFRWASLWCCLASCTAAYGEPAVDDSVELRASRTLQDGEIISFRNNKSGRCIGVDRASTANGALVKQFNCDNSPNQRSRVQRRGIEHTFINVKSGKCMGVDGASVKAGANIGQYNCGNAAPNQSWVLPSDTSDLVRNIFNSKSKLCIGVDRGSTANGAQLKQFACNYTAPNQEWHVILSQDANSPSPTQACSPQSPSTVVAPGVRYYDCSSASPKVHVVTIDRTLTNVDLKILYSPTDKIDIFNLRKPATLAKNANALVAINGYFWKRERGDMDICIRATGRPTTTL